MHRIRKDCVSESVQGAKKLEVETKKPGRLDSEESVMRHRMSEKKNGRKG